VRDQDEDFIKRIRCLSITFFKEIALEK